MSRCSEPQEKACHFHSQWSVFQTTRALYQRLSWEEDRSSTFCSNWRFSERSRWSFQCCRVKPLESLPSGRSIELLRDPWQVDQTRCRSRYAHLPNTVLLSLHLLPNVFEETSHLKIFALFLQQLSYFTWVVESEALFKQSIRGSNRW